MVLGIELFQYLAFLRAQVGIQVEVVLLCGPGETSLSLSSRNGGVAGLIVREFSLLSPSHILGTISCVLDLALIS